MAPSARRTRTRNTTTASSSSFVLPLLLVLVGVSTVRTAARVKGRGEWRLLRASIGISAMHMQLLPDDTVVIFDRTDFGRSNISLPGGRCRFDSYDLALTTDCTAHSVLLVLPSAAVRPLSLLTDTWCSSGALLPNGSLLQTGGFNDGDRAIRLFSPSRGGRSDWVERPVYLSVRRWYASNQLLPDGRVIILGGRRQFSYEFFPRELAGSRTVFRFPFLVETWNRETENNLYPFLHLLPDGTLFVFANDRAVVLDAIRHRVLRRLPPVPGGPRSYPSSGSSVLLPLRPRRRPRGPRLRWHTVGILPGRAQRHLPSGTPHVRPYQADRLGPRLVLRGYAPPARHGRHAPPPHLRRPHRQRRRRRHRRVGASSQPRDKTGPIPPEPACRETVRGTETFADPADVPLDGDPGHVRAGARRGEQPAGALRIRQRDVPDRAEP
ncbi:unnamed protein product [Musa textilis]